MMEPMFQTKICGITTVEDALIVARAGADAIGLNFYARSPRCVAAETAENIVRILPGGISKVGLFVDTPADEIRRLFDRLRLDLIQLHGNQPPEFVAQLGRRPVMRAFRVGPEKLEPVAEYLDRCRALEHDLELVLLDSLVAGAYGGTGRVVDWGVAQAYRADRHDAARFGGRADGGERCRGDSDGWPGGGRRGQRSRVSPRPQGSGPRRSICRGGPPGLPRLSRLRDRYRRTVFFSQAAFRAAEQ